VKTDEPLKRRLLVTAKTDCVGPYVSVCWQFHGPDGWYTPEDLPGLNITPDLARELAQDLLTVAPRKVSG
jgi:hypothetical protein